MSWTLHDLVLPVELPGATREQLEDALASARASRDQLDRARALYAVGRILAEAPAAAPAQVEQIYGAALELLRRDGRRPAIALRDLLASELAAHLSGRGARAEAQAVLLTSIANDAGYYARAQLAAQARESRDLVRAEALVRGAIEREDAILDPASPERWALRLDLAGLCLELGRPTQAIAALRSALEAMSADAGVPAEIAGWTAHTLGVLHLHAEPPEPAQARPCLEEALGIAMRASGPARMLVSRILRDMAKLELLSGEPQRSATLEAQAAALEGASA